MVYCLYNSLEPEPKFQALAPPPKIFLEPAPAIQNGLGSDSTALAVAKYENEI